MIKQFIPEGVCLKCQGCCRFKEADSVWSPCLTDEEIQDLLDKKGLPSVSISIEKKLHLHPYPKGEGFICPLLDIAENKCRIYSSRPFECQLYPFLISLSGKKILLTVDLNCPYAKENLKTKELAGYIKYLSNFLNQPSQVRRLKENPQLIQAYQEVLEIMELKPCDEPRPLL